jgi:hypothetical protein
MTSQLVGSDFTSAAQLPNYVNGRLLTAGDLATSQATLCARDMRIGQAAGHGIVTGLRVTSTATDTLTVAAGLGVTPSGAAISIAASVTLPLPSASSATSPAAGASFSCCTPAPPAGGGSALTAGCYLLTALPACQLTGQAPLAAPPDSMTPAGCAAQWQAQGTQFKAITLPLGETVLGINVTDYNRRNLLAQWCFGSPQLASLGANLLTFAPGYGGFDGLGPADLTADDLPLAVFYWDGAQVGFVDNWSARRRVTAPDPVSVLVAGVMPPWSAVVSDRRTADGQARLLQFQEQAAEVVVSGAAGNTTAATTFPLLPPVGFLRIDPMCLGEMFNSRPPRVDRPEKSLKSLSAALAAQPPGPAFCPPSFFGTAAQFGWFIDWDVADSLLRQSWENMPVATTPPPAEGDPPPLTYYIVIQNFETALKDATVDWYVVFVKNYTWDDLSWPPVAPAG